MNLLEIPARKVVTTTKKEYDIKRIAKGVKTKEDLLQGTRDSFTIPSGLNLGPSSKTQKSKASKGMTTEEVRALGFPVPD